MNYDEFLATKTQYNAPCGFDVELCEINDKLFDWQRAIVKLALKRGRSALFEDCGLGKTAQQLEWARIVYERTGKNVLVLAPLAVSAQTQREGVKFNVSVNVCKSQADVVKGINITNYERLESFNPESFSGIVLDESSILKAFSGKIRQTIQDFAKTIPYRLACTATPAPNDLIEITNHSEFLDIMSGKEVIALFFRQDGNTTHKWRIKGHAEKAFWKWLSSWSIAIRKPSDIGFSDKGYVLPELKIHHEKTESVASDGFLFALEAQTLEERRDARRSSLIGRVKSTAEKANSNEEQWIVWCDLNAESEALTKAINGAVEVKGSDSPEHKEYALNAFSKGEIRVLVTKPSIAGFGMNFQSCHNMAFVGLSDSYEQYYQAVRRCWRFGQKSAVNCYVIASSAEGAVVENIKRKEKQANEMFDKVVDMMDVHSLAVNTERSEMDYCPSVEMFIPDFLTTTKE